MGYGRCRGCGNCGPNRGRPWRFAPPPPPGPPPGPPVPQSPRYTRPGPPPPRPPPPTLAAFHTSTQPRRLGSIYSLVWKERRTHRGYVKPKPSTVHRTGAGPVEGKLAIASRVEIREGPQERERAVLGVIEPDRQDIVGKSAVLEGRNADPVRERDGACGARKVDVLAHGPE